MSPCLAQSKVSPRFVSSPRSAPRVSPSGAVRPTGARAFCCEVAGIYVPTGPWQMGCTPRPDRPRPQWPWEGRCPPTMGKVMVVDDAYSELQVMESILKSAGHEVITYLDAEQLEEKIALQRPDVVLLDVVMPKRNGFDVLRGLRRDERIKTTRVVVVSSKNQESDRLWGLRQGADEYLPKPFTPEQLLTAVRRFVR